jgi:hypothetical protein
VKTPEERHIQRGALRSTVDMLIDLAQHDEANGTHMLEAACETIRAAWDRVVTLED